MDNTTLSALELEYHNLILKEKSFDRESESALPARSLFDCDMLPPCTTSHKPRSAWAALFPAGVVSTPNEPSQPDEVVARDRLNNEEPPLKSHEAEDVLAQNFWDGKEALARLLVSEIKRSHFGPGSECYAYIAAAAQKLARDKSTRGDHQGTNPDAAIKQLLHQAISKEPQHVLATLQDKETVDMVNAILERVPSIAQLDADLADKRIKDRIQIATTPIRQRVHFKSIGVMKSFNYPFNCVQTKVL